MCGPLVDHHCHGLVLRDLSRAEFEGLLNEAAGPSRLGTTLFDSMLGLAVRRWCAPVLDLPPLASADDYLARRTDLGCAEVSRRLLSGSGITEFLVDTGFAPASICSPAQVAELADGRAHEVVRLEALAEDLLASGVPATDLAARLEQALSETTAVGAKSIAAYRVGLALPPSKPTYDDLATALRRMAPDASGRYRLADPVVNGWLAWAALDADLPLQCHVGYGDSDLDLADCDPLRLTAFLRATEERQVPVLLLHNWPYHRHAAYLAQVFDHVFMDLGLATHNAGALATGIMRETLELVPLGKLLFSSDAFGLAELYFLGALMFRRALGGVLSDLIESDEIGQEDTARLVSLVCRDNARRVYRLPT